MAPTSSGRNPFKPTSRLKPPPPPPVPAPPSVTLFSDKQLASNGARGTDDALRVTKILEEHGIPCCLVAISALIFYGAARVCPDWEIGAPTELVKQSAELLQSESYSVDYCMIEPWPFPSASLIHTYNRFKHRIKNFSFILVPAEDVHIVCKDSNITRSLRGLPYPKLDVFVQSCLDMADRVQLVDVVDGTDLPEQWGEDNLELDGFNDVEWAEDINKRGREYANGEFAHWMPVASDASTSRREMWQAAVRSKPDSLDWTKPRDVFDTQYRIKDTPDSWTVLSDMY